MPLIVADVSIFLILKSWLKEQYHNRVVWFYWFSPVLIYISYIHGQLDVIPIALLFGSLYFLYKEHFLGSALLLGMALATKTHIVLVYPFYLLYLFSKGMKVSRILIFFVESIALFVVCNIPYLFNPSFISMVFQNQEQGKLFNIFISLKGLRVFLIPSALILLFIRGGLLKTYNRDIFMMFLGFVFSIIVFFIPPMQGWYFWLIPFLSYFYIKEKGYSPILFGLLQLSYLLYFLLVKDSDYTQVFDTLFKGIHTLRIPYDYFTSVGINADQMVNLAFTALQTILVINCFWIYRKGIESYRKHKITASPFLVGIGGNSGVGKTTLSHALSQLFTPQHTTVLCGDDMHRWQRGHEKWDELTHFNPKANYLHKEIESLKQLKRGRKISRQHYDHNVGGFTQESQLQPNNIIIFEGLHPFYLPSQRSLYDLKIFITSSLELMYHWKIIRDKEMRGYSKEKVMEVIAQREQDSKKYIETQLSHSDIVIKVLAMEKITDIGNPAEPIAPYYHLTLSNDVYIESLLETFNTITSLNITHQYTLDDKQEVVLQGTCSDIQLREIAGEYLDDVRDLGVNNPKIPTGLFGVLLLLLTYCIFEKGEYDRE